MFGFNSPKDFLSLINSCVLRILVNKRDIEPTVIKRANQFISFKFRYPADGYDELFWRNKKSWFILEGGTNLQKQKDSHHTDSLIPLTKCRKQNFSRMMLFTVNFVAVNLLKQITLTMLTYWKVDLQQNKPLSNWNYQNNPLLGLRHNNDCNRYGSRNKWAQAKTFCAGITKMYFTIFGANAKCDCLLPRQGYPHVKAWFYFTKPGQHLSIQI